jgi:hypothetical protein
VGGPRVVAVTEIVRDQHGETFELRAPQFDDDDTMQLSVRDVLDRLQRVTGVLQNRDNRDAMAQALADIGRTDPVSARSLEFAALRAQVEQALNDGALRLAPHVLELRPVVELIDVEPAPLVEEAAEVIEATHTLELELLDPDGKPVANAPYSVELPGGDVVTGQLNALGKVLLSGIHGTGDCKITFTSYDQDAWVPA